MTARATAPVGVATRGTTAPNRLRRADRWLLHRLGPLLRRASRPLVVDLGYGATPVTTAELADRLRAVRRDVEVMGVEIDPQRVAAAVDDARPGLSFRVGGFDLPLPEGRRAMAIRAFNVLRQYPEAEVAGAWELLVDRLAPGGLLLDGTCDEMGRRAAWLAVGAAGPRGRAAAVSLTLSTRLAGLERPGALAERLPKALIHRNVPGEPVHALLAQLDRAWAICAPWGSYGVRQRWVAMARTARAAGVPVLDGPGRWRLGELTVAWPPVAAGRRPC